MTSPLWGVDVSRWRGAVDWPRVYQAGVQFAFAKTTEGIDSVDPQWAANRAGMLVLDDFLPGAYHFLRGDADIKAQVAHFLDHAGDVTAMAVALDVEIRKDAARQATAADAKAWVTEFKWLTGGHPVIGYFPAWFWDAHGKPDLSFFDSLWASHYVTGPGTHEDRYARVPATWWATYGNEPVSILQFSSSGSVPGVPPPVDLNAFRGSLAELRTIALGEPMAYPYVEARNHGGTQSTISRVVVHATVSPTKTGGARDIANYFHSTTNEASAHYVVDPGQIYQCLHENVVAWHAPPNTGSIGIELCDPQTGATSRWQDSNHEAMLRLAAKLTREVAKRHNVPLVKLSAADLKAGKRGICGHADVSAAFRQTDHTDPGTGFPWAHFMDLVKGEDVDMAITDEDALKIAKLVWSGKGMDVLTAPGLQAGETFPTKADPANKTWFPASFPRQTIQGLWWLGAKVDALAKESGVDVDEEALAAALLVQLAPEKIAALVAASLPADLAKQVADELAARLES